MPDTDPMRVTVLVNGQREEVRTERDTALLYVLRNHLGLTGTRFGCGLGLCGACLVLIDGRPDTPSPSTVVTSRFSTAHIGVSQE
jgi:nicotinate dehydrogenase subunit A